MIEPRIREMGDDF